MSSEPSLYNVPNVSRLHNVRLDYEENDEPEEVVNPTISGNSSPETASRIQPIDNVILPRVRRALNFISDENQSTSSMARSEESSTNRDYRLPTNAADALHMDRRSQNTVVLKNSHTNSQTTVANNWQETTIRERMAFLFNKKILSDVSFIVEAEKEHIPAHKLVLFSGSADFDAMFNKTLAMASSEIEVPDVKPNTFFVLLIFLYTNKIIFDSETVMRTFYIAKKYAVWALERHCVDYLKSNLMSDKVFLLLTQARLFDKPQLAAVCLDAVDRFTSEALDPYQFPDIDIG